MHSGKIGCPALLQTGIDRKTLAGSRLSAREYIKLMESTEKFLWVAANENTNAPRWIQRADGINDALNCFAVEHKRSPDIKGLLFVTNANSRKRKRRETSQRWKGHFGGRISYVFDKSPKIPILGKQCAKYAQQDVPEGLVSVITSRNMK